MVKIYIYLAVGIAIIAVAIFIVSYIKKYRMKPLPMDEMEGHDFEYYCADLLKTNGFSEATVTKGSGDFGADILAEKDGITYAVQCKCYDKPIGVKAVFERWSDQEGKNWYQVKLVYQSVEQLRSIQPLSLEQPPMIVPISFAGIETNADGMIAEKDLMELFRNRINRYYELEEIYGETTEQAEEPAA